MQTIGCYDCVSVQERRGELEKGERGGARVRERALIALGEDLANDLDSQIRERPESDGCGRHEWMDGC